MGIRFYLTNPVDNTKLVAIPLGSGILQSIVNQKRTQNAQALQNLQARYQKLVPASS